MIFGSPTKALFWKGFCTFPEKISRATTNPHCLEWCKMGKNATGVKPRWSRERGNSTDTGENPAFAFATVVVATASRDNYTSFSLYFVASLVGCIFGRENKKWSCYLRIFTTRSLTDRINLMLKSAICAPPIRNCAVILRKCWRSYMKNFCLNVSFVLCVLV